MRTRTYQIDFENGDTLILEYSYNTVTLLANRNIIYDDVKIQKSDQFLVDTVEFLTNCIPALSKIDLMWERIDKNIGATIIYEENTSGYDYICQFYISNRNEYVLWVYIHNGSVPIIITKHSVANASDLKILRNSVLQDLADAKEQIENELLIATERYSVYNEGFDDGYRYGMNSGLGEPQDDPRPYDGHYYEDYQEGWSEGEDWGYGDS